MPKFANNLDVNKNYLNNAAIQSLSSDPSSPVVGQIYFNTSTNRLRQYNGTTWVQYSDGAGNGDVNQTANSGGAGRMKVSAGANKTITDYATAGIVKSDSNGVVSAATPGTDYTTSSSSETFTNKNFDANGTGNSLTNLEVADFAASAVNSNTTLATASNSQFPTALAVKTYADNLLQGLSWKQAVAAASTANLTLSGTQTVDGVALVAGDRILVKNQTTGSANGIYVVASGAWSRSTDADSSAEIDSMTVYVEQGTVNADTVWTLTTDNPTIGTTALVYAQVNGGTVPAATTATSGRTRYATTAETEAKTVTDAAITPSGLTSYTRKFTTTIGDNSATSIAVTHGLGTQFVTAQVFEVSTNASVEPDITLTSATQTTFTFSVAPTSGQYRVVIVG